LATLSASSTNSIGLLIDQRGTSDIVNFQDAGTTVFTILDGGNVGIGTTSPYAKLSVVGNTVLDSNLIEFASSSASSLTLAYNTAATSTVVNNESYAWTIATSTDVTPLFRIDTTGGGNVTVGNGTGDVIIGDVGSAANLVFEESSTIHGQGGNTLTFGTTGDIINFAVNLGVATTSPYRELSVTGDGVFTGSIDVQGASATSTFAGGLDIGAGDFLVDFSSGNTTVGNYLSIDGASGTSTIASGLNVGSGDFVYDFSSGNVGIRTDAPASALAIRGAGSLLDVRGTGDSTPVLAVSDSGDIHVVQIGAPGIAGNPFFLGGILEVAGAPGGDSRASIAVLEEVNNAEVLFGVINSDGGLGEVGTVSNDDFRIITNNSTVARFTAGGNAGIASTSPWRTLSVDGTVGFSSSLTAESGSDNYVCIDPTTYEITNGGADCGASSLQYKENIETLDYGLAEILALNPVSFNWKASERPNDPGRKIGLIAEDVINIIPEVVGLDGEGNPESIDYDKLTSLLAKGIQEFGQRINVVAGPTSTPSIYIDENGNVGVGTTSPLHKLEVAGDVAATGFINISKRDSKKDIEYLSAEKRTGILAEIDAVSIAEYHYKNESEEDPLRLGLIADEAPSDILSADGAGVDLYKLTTFTLAGVQELSRKVSEIEMRLEALESATATVAVVDENSYIDLLKSWGVKFIDGVVRIAQLFAENLTVGSPQSPAGITLYDEATGEPYCVRVRNGELVPTAGECGTVEEEALSTTPMLELLGDSVVYVEAGQTFYDPGVATTSAIVGTSTLRYAINGSGPEDTLTFYTNEFGDHYVHYLISDSAGNHGTTTRKVVVFEAGNPEFEGVETSEPIEENEGLASTEDIDEDESSSASTTSETASSASPLADEIEVTEEPETETGAGTTTATSTQEGGDEEVSPEPEEEIEESSAPETEDTSTTTEEGVL
jgi:hypothetical protein